MESLCYPPWNLNGLAIDRAVAARILALCGDRHIPSSNVLSCVGISRKRLAAFGGGRLRLSPKQLFDLGKLLSVRVADFFQLTGEDA